MTKHDRPYLDEIIAAIALGYVLGCLVPVAMACYFIATGTM